MKVLRSTLVVGAAIFAAACGDKVNVVQPVTPHGVNSVVVTPATPTINVGDKLLLTASVNADSGVATTVTWKSADATKASVDATGNVTGVAATAGVSICATSTVDASKQGCAAVIVSPQPTPVPATVTIQSITAGPLGLNGPVPVPPAGVAGQINVTVNQTPGTAKVDSVAVTINGKTAQVQSFTAAQAAQLRTAGDLAAAHQATTPTIVFSINTAAYNPTTGAVTYPNGAAAIGATIYAHQGATATQANAAQSTNLLFANADAWVVAQTLSPTPAPVANNGNGFAFTTGAVSVTAIPVLYSGAAIATAQVNYGTPGCDASGSAQRTQALAAPAAGTFAWTATFAKTSVAPGPVAASALNTVNSYEFSQALCPGLNAGGGEGATVAASQYTSTNSGPTGFALGTGGPVARLDNRAPTGAALFTNAAFGTPSRTNSWLNDAIVLNATATANPANGAIITAATDPGVGGITYVSSVNGTALTSVASIAETATNTAFTLSTVATDALGNSAAAITKTFGVDRTAPTLAFVGGTANNAQLAAFTGVNYTLAATDNATAPAAPSGFFNLGLTPLSTSQNRRDVVNGSFFWCPSTAAYQKSTTACANPNGWATGTTNYSSNLNFSEYNASAVDAYYTATSTVSDQAGNISNAASRVELVDATAPAIGGLSYPPFLTAGGAATFSSTTQDNLDIQLERLNLQYGPIQPGVPGAFAATMFDGNTGAAFAPTTALGGSTFWYPDQIVNTYNAATLITTHAMAFTANPVLTMIQTRATTDGTGSALNANGVVNTANGIVLNQANTATASATPIVPGSVPTATALTNTGLAGAGPVKFVICGVGAACPAVYATPVAAAAVAISRTVAPTSVTLTAIATGTASVFNNPFSAVQFWAYDPTAGATEGWRLIGTVTNAATVTDAGGAEPAGRNWSFSMTWAPTVASAPDNATYKIVAIGIGGSNLPAAQQGMAIATPLSYRAVTVAP